MVSLSKHTSELQAINIEISVWKHQLFIHATLIAKDCNVTACQRCCSVVRERVAHTYNEFVKLVARFFIKFAVSSML